MALTEITAKAGRDEDAPSATVTYDFGDNLQEAVERFGEDVVFNRFKSAVIIDIQALIRRELNSENPPSPEELQAKVNEWKPGTSRVRKSKVEKAMELLAAMSEEDRQKLLAEL